MVRVGLTGIRSTGKMASGFDVIVKIPRLGDFFVKNCINFCHSWPSVAKGKGIGGIVYRIFYAVMLCKITV